MTRKFFGTDGVRGVVGEFLTAELALALAREATTIIRRRQGCERVRVLIVRDPRESGEMLESAVAEGVLAAGGVALLAGVLPTPAAPLLLRHYEFELAIVLSASHNPYYDNGIKFFGPDGYKLTDEQEAEIEAAIEQAASNGNKHTDGESRGVAQAGAEVIQDGSAASEPAGRIERLYGGLEDYLRILETRFGQLSLAGKRIALDCANGATYEAAPEIMRRLGAEVEVINAQPDGRNINEGCGSTNPAALQQFVCDRGADIGFAFDGDGDRVIAISRDGSIVDGDELLALIAAHLHNLGQLSGDGVVVTVMTNYGFHLAMKDAGIEVVTTPVGDRYVLEVLRERSWLLGGEQSGHIINMDFVPSGDGIATALLALEALADADLSPDRLINKLPQRLINVRVPGRPSFEERDSITQALTAAQEALSGRGRVLLRPSGTEPLIRVMVEAPTESEAHEICSRLAGVVEKEFGVVE